MNTCGKSERMDSYRTRIDKMRNGAVTVEAAIVLPVLLCALLSVIFLVKAVYAYELVNHALNETASEIASSAYIYHVSGIRDLHDTVRNNVNENADIFKEQIGSVFDIFNSLNSVKKEVGQGAPYIADSAELLQEAGQNFNNLFDNMENMKSDPLEELKSIACYIASGTFDDAKTQIFTPVVKLTMKKYLVTDSMPDADTRLKQLNIKEGFVGMDFSGSSFLADRGENIDIVVRYKLHLPLPVQFIPALDITQRARARAWMGGDETSGVLDASQTADDLWSLDNFQRGQKIRRLFNANLPSSFPVIARFSEGKAVMIKSMDMTAASYQTGDNAEKLLVRYISELARYKGQEKPWGSAGIVIKGSEIKSRELLLVIPQNKLSDTSERLLASMASMAESRGVKLTVKRYGMKMNKSDAGDNSGVNQQAGTGDDQ